MRIAMILILLATSPALAQGGAASPSGGICIGTPAECAGRLVATREGFDLRVTFELNSAELTPDGRERLSRFAQALVDNRLKQRKFIVEGHTDAYGSAEYNLVLSKRRAQAVVDFLASSGVPADQMRAVGKGQSEPRTDNPYDRDNRRVELHVD